MKLAMNSMNDTVAALFGIVGGIITSLIMGITWQNAWENAGNLLWLGFVAMFTGGMGIVGKKLVEKYWDKRKKNK